MPRTTGLIATTSTRRRRAVVLAASALFAVLAAACFEGRTGQDPSQVPQSGGYDPNNPYAQQPPNAYGQPAPYPQQGGYPQQYPQGSPPQGGYPPQGQAGYGSPPPGQYTPGQPTAAAAQSPLALPCQNDLICGTHKCNLTSQRCAFPCAANTDCAAGFTCLGAGGPAAVCVPGAQ